MCVDGERSRGRGGILLTRSGSLKGRSYGEGQELGFRHVQFKILSDIRAEYRSCAHRTRPESGIRAFVPG